MHIRIIHDAQIEFLILCDINCFLHFLENYILLYQLHVIESFTLFEYLFESGKCKVSFRKSKHYKVVSIYLVDVSRMTFKVNWCRNSCIQKVFISSFARKEDVCIIRVKWPVILRRKLIICVRLKKLIARKIRCVNETNMLQNTFIVLHQEV